MPARLWLIAPLALLACASQPTPVAQEVGGLMPATPIEDQYGTPHSLLDVRLVLLSRDMEGGDLIREALAEAGPDALEKRDAVYVADISGMPSLIARMFAIPKMRERPYPMLLDRDGSLTADWPSEAGKATLLYVHDRRITGVRHLDRVDLVVAALRD